TRSDRTLLSRRSTLATPPTRLLEVHNLDAFYGRSQVLFDVSVGLDPGEIVAVLGRNGVGKTTLVHTIMNFGPRGEGAILLDGQSIVGLPSYQIVRRGLGLVPSDRRVFRELTVLQNLAIPVHPTKPLGPRWSIDDTLELFPELAAIPGRMGWQL